MSDCVKRIPPLVLAPLSQGCPLVDKTANENTQGRDKDPIDLSGKAAHARLIVLILGEEKNLNTEDGKNTDFSHRRKKVLEKR